jgi:hypothetical protein
VEVGRASSSGPLAHQRHLSIPCSRRHRCCWCRPAAGHGCQCQGCQCSQGSPWPRGGPGQVQVVGQVQVLGSTPGRGKGGGNGAGAEGAGYSWMCSFWHTAISGYTAVDVTNCTTMSAQASSSGVKCKQHLDAAMTV